MTGITNKNLTVYPLTFIIDLMVSSLVVQDKRGHLSNHVQNNRFHVEILRSYPL